MVSNVPTVAASRSSIDATFDEPCNCLPPDRATCFKIPLLNNTSLCPFWICLASEVPLKRSSYHALTPYNSDLHTCYPSNTKIPFRFKQSC